MSSNIYQRFDCFLIPNRALCFQFVDLIVIPGESTKELEENLSVLKLVEFKEVIKGCV